MANKKVVYGIAGDNSIFKKKMKEVTDKFKGFEHTAKGVVGRVKKNWLGVTAAIGGTVLFIKKATDAYMKQETAEQNLAQALKNTGEYSKKGFQNLKDYASQLQNVTTVGDEVSLGAMQFGLSMGISAKHIKTATKNAIGLSTAYHIDLNTAMKAVAETQQNNFQTLGRYDRRIMSAKTNTEKMALAQEDMANGFKLAQAQVFTLSGRLSQMKNSLGDNMEGIGGGFADALSGWALIITKISDKLKTLPKIFSKGIAIIIAGIGIATVAVTAFGASVSIATGGISLAIAAVIGGIGWMAQNWKATKLGFMVGIDAIVYGLEWMAQFILNDFSKSFNKPIRLVNKLIRTVNKLTHKHLKELKEVDFSKGITKSVNKSKKKLDEEVAALKKANAEMDAAKKAKAKGKDGTAPTASNGKDELAGYLATAQTEIQIENAKYAKMQKLAKNNQEVLDKLKEKHAENVSKINAKMFKAQVQATQTALGQIAGLMSESNSTLFNIGKAAAITNATISGYEAVAKTMASVPFPFNIPLAIAQGAASAVQIAKIASTQPPKAARGALLNSATTLTAGESGRELVLPNYLTERIINMTTPNNNATINFNINGTVIDDMALKDFTKKVMNQQDTIINNNEAY